MQSPSNLDKVTNLNSTAAPCTTSENEDEAEKSGSSDVSYLSKLLFEHCIVDETNRLRENNSFQRDCMLVDPLSCSFDTSSIRQVSMTLSSEEGSFVNDQANSTENLLSVTIPETESEGGLSDVSIIDSITNISDEASGNSEDEIITSAASEIRNEMCNNHFIDNYIDLTTQDVLRRATSLVKSPFKDATLNASIEDFSVSSNKAVSANLASTPRQETHVKSALTKCNQAQLVNDSANDSTVTTRGGRVVRQRIQLSFDGKVESDNSDESFEIAETKMSQTILDYSSKSNVQHGAKHLMYLDLSKELIDDYLSTPTSVQVNNDEIFKQRLQKFLGATNKRRILYTQTFGDEPEDDRPQDISCYEANIRGNVLTKNRQLAYVDGPVGLSLAAALSPQKKKAQIKIYTPPHNQAACKRHKYLQTYLKEHELKYNFIQSLDVTVPEKLCHPKAHTFNAKFSTHRKQLTNILYDLYNHKVFNCALDVEIVWKQMFSKPSNCLNKSSKEGRTSVVELNLRLITSTKGLCIAIMHELCHAAAWIFNGESGHGVICEEWLYRANQILPGLPQIKECNRPAHVYTYICIICDAKSQGSLTLEPVDRVRCNYCYGAIEIQTNTKDPHTLPISTKNKLTGLVEYIKGQYNRVACTQNKHTEIMNIINNEYLTNY